MQSAEDAKRMVAKINKIREAVAEWTIEDCRQFAEACEKVKYPLDQLVALVMDFENDEV